MALVVLWIWSHKLISLIQDILKRVQNSRLKYCPTSYWCENTMSKSDTGKKGLFGVALATCCSIWVESTIRGCQSGKRKQEPGGRNEVEAMQYCLLSRLCGFLNFLNYVTTEACLPRDGTTHSGQIPPASILIQENAPQTFWEANLKETVPQLTFPLSRSPYVCQADKTQPSRTMFPLTMWSWEWNPRPNIKFFYALLFFKSILLVHIYVHSMYVWVRDACVWGVHIEDRTTMGVFLRNVVYLIETDILIGQELSNYARLAWQ